MEMRSDIFVALSTFSVESPAPLELLKSSGHGFMLNTTGKRLTREQIVDMAPDAVGIVAGVEPYDAWVLDRLPKLRCISRCGVGLDAIDLGAARAKGITVLNTPDVVVRPVAELTLAMAFDLLKRLTLHTEYLRRGEWKKVTGGMLKGRSVGVIGLGRIGRAVAELFAAMGACVMGCDVAPDEAWALRAGVRIVGKDELLKCADIVTLHVSLSKGAPAVVGGRELSLMKKTAFLINTSRGGAVDAEALASVLGNGNLAGAGLDVFPEEPYAGDLCRMPHVVLTPHIATLTEESRVEMECQAVENLRKFLENRQEGVVL